MRDKKNQAKPLDQEFEALPQQGTRVQAVPMGNWGRVFLSPETNTQEDMKVCGDHTSLRPAKGRTRPRGSSGSESTSAQYRKQLLPGVCFKPSYSHGTVEGAGNLSIFKNWNITNIQKNCTYKWKALWNLHNLRWLPNFPRKAFFLVNTLFSGSPRIIPTLTASTGLNCVLPFI